MKIFKPLIGAAMACLLLTGCTTLSQDISNVQTLYSQVKTAYAQGPKTVFTLEGGYTIVQTAAAAFKTNDCASITDLNGACATIVPKLRSYNAQALAIIAPVEAFVRANPTLDTSGLISTAEKSITLISQEMTALGIPAASPS